MKKLMQTINNIPPERLALCLLLAVTFFAGTAAFLLAPKATFSADENRVLAPFPQPDADTVLSGQFAKGVEAYVDDHFFGRERFVTLNTTAQLAIGKRDIGGNYSSSPADGGVYFGRGGHLFEVLLKPQGNTFDKNSEALFDFAKRSNLPFTLLAIPSSAQEMPQLLPDNAPEYDQHQLLVSLKAKAPANCRVPDAFGCLRYRGSAQTDYYFKTDHHWNLYGAYQGYSLLAESMGLTPRPLSGYRLEKASVSFYGTLYSKALPSNQPADSILLPTAKSDPAITQQTGSTTHSGLFWRENLQKKDQYTVYLGGNHGLDIIRCKSAPARRLLIIKDSFADSLLPFLAPDFSEIHVIDLRYFRGDIDRYIHDNKIDQIAAVYSLKQLTEVDISSAIIS